LPHSVVVGAEQEMNVLPNPAKFGTIETAHRSTADDGDFHNFKLCMADDCPDSIRHSSSKIKQKKAFRPSQSAFGESPGLPAVAVQAAGWRRGESDVGFHIRRFFTGFFPAALFYLDNKPPEMRNRPGL